MVIGVFSWVMAAEQFWNYSQGSYIIKPGSNLGANYSSAIVYSPITTALIKAGMPVNLNKKLAIDFFLGAGVRMIATNYKVTDIQLRTFEQTRYNCLPWNDPATDYNSTLVRFHATAGLRLGINF